MYIFIKIHIPNKHYFNRKQFVFQHDTYYIYTFDINFILVYFIF